MTIPDMDNDQRGVWIFLCPQTPAGSTRSTLLQTNGNPMSIYHGSGSQCTDPLDPSSPQWTTNNTAYTVSGLAVISLRNTACSSATCCTLITCDVATGQTCSNANATMAYVPPAPATCAITAAPVIALGLNGYAYRSDRNCAARSSTKDVTVYNPYNAAIYVSFFFAGLGEGAQIRSFKFIPKCVLQIFPPQVYSTDGIDCSKSPASSTNFRYYVDYSTSSPVTSSVVSFQGAPCASSPCCTFVYCAATNPSSTGCFGLSVTQSFPGNTDGSKPAQALAAGIIAAIVIVILLVAAGGIWGYLIQRAKRYAQHAATYQNNNRQQELPTVLVQPSPLYGVQQQQPYAAYPQVSGGDIQKW